MVLALPGTVSSSTGVRGPSGTLTERGVRRHAEGGAGVGQLSAAGRVQACSTVTKASTRCLDNRQRSKVRFTK